jgi:uncharacterized protein YqgV (UPF0045/DUF77 family)
MVLTVFRSSQLAGAKRIISSIRIAERLDASKTLEDEVGSVTEKFK